MRDAKPSLLRRFARAVAMTPAVASLAAVPAFADTPAAWPDAGPISTLHVILVLVVIPVALFVLITLAVYVPSMARGNKYEPGQAWRNENEWFGGPRGGVETADKADPATIEGVEESDRGGASVRW